MNKQPPRYTLDTQTAQLAATVIGFARELARVQHNTQSRDTIMEIADELSHRLSLNTPDPEPQSCEVVALRPFRVVNENT